MPRVHSGTRPSASASLRTVTAALPTSPTPRPEPTHAPKTRDALIDNSRAVLIVLVVLGHIVMTYHNDSRIIGWAHYAIYLFHMPAFAYFSGKVLRSPQRAFGKAFSAIFPLYVGFSLIHFAVRRYFSGHWEWAMWVAPGLMWYLLALLVWRLMLPLWDKLRWPILTSIAVALCIPLTTRLGSTLALERIFVFAPFFLMGHYTTQDLVERIRRVPAVLTVVPIVAIAGIAALAERTGFIKMALLNGYTPYAGMAGSTWSEMAERILVIGTTLGALFVLWRLMPRRKVFWTHLGTYSLGIYTLHMSWPYALQKWHPHLGTDKLVIAAILLSPLVVAFFLASPPVRTVVGWYERTWRRGLLLLAAPSKGGA